MPDHKAPLRQFVDLAVYAPVGLLTVAQRELPSLISAGKARVENQITLARFLGKMAIKQGRKELKRRLDEAEARRNGDVIEATATDADAAHTDGREQTVTTRPAADESLPEAIIEAVEARAGRLDGAPHPAGLPIDGYDNLAASQVVMRLASLTPAELEIVRAHEESHRARRTVLGKIQQLQGR